MLWILQFLLGLLKIIGIVLLTMVCFVLLLVLLILFGAIRYKVEGSAKNRESTGQVLLETLHVNAKVSWLNPLFRVFVKVRGKQVAYQVKVFGFCVLDSEKPPKPKKPKKLRKSPKKITSSKVTVTTETTSMQTEQEVSGLEEKQAETVLTNAEQEVSNVEEAALADTTSEKQNTDVVDVQQKQQKAEEPLSELLQNTDESPDSLSEDEPVGNSKKKKKAKKAKKKATKEEQNVSGETGEKKKFSFAELEEKIAKLQEKKDLIMEFLQEETTKLTIAGTFRTIKKVILHILPVSIHGNIIYGSGDPASTGKAFAVLGILYAKYGESLNVLADFEEKRLEADVQIKGHIRLGTMAWYVILFVLKKETRAFIKRCMQLIKKIKA